MKTARRISLGVALALFLMTGSAAAERVWTKTASSLYAEPSPKSRRVARVKANRSLTVVGKKGRWLRVKKGAKSGWILRAQVRTRQRGGRGRPAGGRASADRDDRRSPASDASASSAGDTDESPASDERTSDGASPPDGASSDEDTRARRCRKDAVWCGEDQQGEAIHVVVIPSRVDAYKEPGADQDIAFRATQDQELVVIGYHRPDWFYVQTLDGKFGWIPKTAVRQKGNLVNPRGDGLPEIDPRKVERKAKPPKAEPPKGKPAAGKPDPLRISANAGLGVAVLGRSFTATNVEQAGYEASSMGVATHVAADARYRVSGSWHAGIDGTYAAIVGTPGLAYSPGGGGQDLDVGAFILHRFEASGKLGYDSGFGAFLRAGFLVETFYLNNLFNDAFLPRERLVSPTVGLDLEMADLFAGVGLALRADVLLGGSFAQTRGLEDGDFDGLFALSGQLDASYPLGRRLSIHALYRFDQVAPSWTGASTRAPGVNEASRTDQSHRLLLSAGMHF